MTTILPDPWTPFGLRSNPYFQEPLSIESTADRPVALLVGREAERTLLLRQIAGDQSSRAVVQGPAGVGKTSLVNALKAALGATGGDVLTHAEPIRVLAEMTSPQFAAEVLRLLLLLHEADPEPTPRTGKAATFWKGVERRVRGEDGAQVGATFGPLGGSYQPTRIAGELPGLALYPEIKEAARLLATRSSARAPRRLFLHVNNLENLSAPDARAAADLLRDLRDYFQIPGTHWVFVGSDAIEATIFRVHPQVGGIVDAVVTLEPLTTEELEEALHRRYRHLQRGRRLIPPVAPDTVRTLYARYQGDLRDFLRLLSGAVKRGAHGATPLTVADVHRAMAAPTQAAFRRRLDETTYAHAVRLLGGAPADQRLRVTDVALRLGMTQAGASAVVARLDAGGVLRFDAAEGRSRFYRVTGDAGVAFSTG